MMQETLPKYVKNASFIDVEYEVNEDWWPRDPHVYDPTHAFRSRMRRLSGIVDPADVKEAVQLGDIYRAANNNIAFVNDLGGLVIYVIMDAELMQIADEYPTDPDKTDYWFKGVTVWPYIYDRNKALDTGKWSYRELNVVEQIKKENMEIYK